MFIQVIKGKVSDPAAVKAALERWQDELSAGAAGWLGTTSGVTRDGTLIALARFDSEDNARLNSDRPEQGAWWAETSKLFEGEVTFAESAVVDVDLPGDPDQAGFVQVMQGQVLDPDRARELQQRDPEKWRDYRPDILGTVNAVHQGGAYTMAAYFTSEAAAREGENAEPPPEIIATMTEMGELFIGETTYFDLTDPWLTGPQ
jgi:hypothetical protein